MIERIMRNGNGVCLGECAHRRGARLLVKQGNLADDFARPPHGEHHVLPAHPLRDLEFAGANDIERAAGVALAHQVFTGRDHDVLGHLTQAL